MNVSYSKTQKQGKRGSFYAKRDQNSRLFKRNKKQLLQDEAVKNASENAYDITTITYTNLMRNNHRAVSFGGTVVKGAVAVGDLIPVESGTYEIIGIMQGMDGVISAREGEYAVVMVTTEGNQFYYKAQFKKSVVAVVKK